MKKMEELTYHWGIIMEIYPSFAQRKTIIRNAGAYRYVYNKLVAINNEIYRLNKVKTYISEIEIRKSYLKETKKSAQSIKNASPFLYEKDIDSDVVANAILNYSNAWKNMKTIHSGIPTFHKKSNCYSYKTSNHYNKASNPNNLLFEGSIYFIDRNHIHLPKLGIVRFKCSKKLINKLFTDYPDTRIGSCKISHDETGRCYMSMSLGNDKSFYEVYPNTNKNVGCDLNLENFLYDSDGRVEPNPKYLIKSQNRLIKLQKSLSRKQEKARKENRDFRNSKNYQKTRMKLAKLHKHITNQRKAFHFKTSDKLVKTHDFLVFEDLKSKNLSQNHSLAKAINDAGWRSFLTKCEWTATKHGKKVLLVPAKNTTQTCNCCGYVLQGEEKLTLKERTWTCPNCHKEHIRDLNAAINILNRGLELLGKANRKSPRQDRKMFRSKELAMSAR